MSIVGESLITVQPGEITLDVLAASINTEDDAARQHVGQALKHARRCGELLIQAKARLPHGGWLPWLTSNCHVGERQARNYMRIADGWERILKSAPSSALSIKQALRLVSRGQAARDRYNLPALTDDHRLLCLGERSLACIEPVGGGYFYVGVYRDLDRDEPHIIELPRGIRADYVDLVLQKIGFEPVGEWEVEPFDGERPDKDCVLVWSLAARQYSRARIAKSEAAAL